MLSERLERPWINPVLVTSGAGVGVGTASLSADFGKSHPLEVWSLELRSQLQACSISLSYTQLKS